jgi:hypothetical protein
MFKYVIKYGESIIDVSVKLYSNVSYVYELIKLNPILQNINNESITGLEINYEPILTNTFKPVVTTETILKKNVTIRQNQSIFDVSLQIFGTTERVLDVLKLGNISSINEQNLANINFDYEYEATIIPKYILQKGYTVSTLKSITTGRIAGVDYLLLEDGYYLLQENNSKIIL